MSALIQTLLLLLFLFLQHGAMHQQKPLYYFDQMVSCTIQIPLYFFLGCSQHVFSFFFFTYIYIYIFSYVAVNIPFFLFHKCLAIPSIPLFYYFSSFSVSASLETQGQLGSYGGCPNSIQSKRLLETGVVLAWPREHGIVKQEPPYRDIDDSGVDGGTREGGLCGFILAITISNNQVFMGVLKIRRKQRDLGFQVWWDSSGSLETSCQVRVFSSHDDFRS